MIHKWHVFWACLKLGVPLWRALMHDWTKFLPCEFPGYATNFFHPDGTRIPKHDASGHYDKDKQSDAYKLAWNHHQKNKHHWESWTSIGPTGGPCPLPIPRTYLDEMIADWMGAGMALRGIKDPREWYEKNKDKMLLHPTSRGCLELLLETYTYLYLYL